MNEGHQVGKIIGRKYATEVLAGLEGGELRFNELKERLNLPTSKTLAWLLRFMVNEGILRREERPRNAVFYGLTEKGRELAEVVKELREWERKWNGE